MAATIAARAKAKQVKGGELGGNPTLSTTLSKGSAINTRAEIAKAAGVSEGQVAKVKKIEEKGTPEPFLINPY